MQTLPQPLMVFRGGQRSLNVVKFVSDDICTFSDEGVVDVWDLESRRIKVSKSLHHASIQSVDVIEESKLLGTSGRDGYYKLWNKENSDYDQPVTTLHTGAHHFCNATIFQPSTNNTTYLASPSENESCVTIWDIHHHHHTKLSSFTLNESYGMVTRIQWNSNFSLSDNLSTTMIHSDTNPSSGLLYVGSEDGSLTVFDIRSQRKIWCKKIHDNQPIFAMDIHPHRHTIVTGSADNTARFTDISTTTTATTTAELQSTSGSNKIESETMTHQVESGINCIKFRADHKILISCQWDGVSRIYEYSKKRQYRQLSALRFHRDCATCVDFNTNISSQYYNMFATCSRDGTMALWDLYANTRKKQ